jgi:hypothetical protein
MYWHESQHEPGKIDISFPAAQAGALREACDERTAVRELLGNSPLAFDESVVRIINSNIGKPSVELRVDAMAFHDLPQLILEFAQRTKEVTLPPDSLSNGDENTQQPGYRAEQGIIATHVLFEIEGAVAAYDSDFHGKLEAFMDSLNPKS